MLGRVRRERGLQTVELGRPPRVRSDAGGDDHAFRRDRVAVVQRDAKRSRPRLDPSDAAAVQRVGDFALHPPPVADEIVQPHRPRQRDAPRPFILVEREFAVRVRDVGALPVRAEEHPGGHLALPEGHAFAENVRFHAPDRSQMSGRREPVRACTYDRYPARQSCHWTLPCEWTATSSVAGCRTQTSPSHLDARTFGSTPSQSGSGCSRVAHAISAAGRFAPARCEKG